MNKACPAKAYWSLTSPYLREKKSWKKKWNLQKSFSARQRRMSERPTRRSGSTLPATAAAKAVWVPSVRTRNTAMTMYMATIPSTVT